MNQVLETIGQLGLVPVIKIDRAADAPALGRALLEGDLPVAEVTFRTAAAEEAIQRLTAELPDLLVGAGTVLTVDQAKRALAAGARFIVSPGFNPKVVDYCLEHDIPVTPGTDGPTSMEMALERGLEVVKFFPAEAAGGLKFLKAVAAPYAGLRFIPTGGVNAANAGAYLAFDKIHAVGGSWMVESKLISEGRFDEITRRVREAVGLVLGFELAHLTLGQDGPAQALAAAEDLGRLFLLPVAQAGPEAAVGTGLRFSGQPQDRGVISLATASLARAAAYLERKKVPFSRTEAGLSLDGPIGGLAVRLIQK